MSLVRSEILNQKIRYKLPQSNDSYQFYFFCDTWKQIYRLIPS